MRVWSSEYSLVQKFHHLFDMLACSRPVPYDCVVTHRFPEVESILEEERERFGI